MEEPVVLGLGNPVAAADSNLAAPLQDKVQVSSLTRHSTLFTFLKKSFCLAKGQKVLLLKRTFQLPCLGVRQLMASGQGPSIAPDLASYVAFAAETQGQ